ncbi:hypothetical protein [Cohnella cellulosilytica]|uniref:Flp pilus-assembly TadG-like N-terminal domain-containing protein n=1 Tax=Cohnella cellulosilytica TaxID=986710 RepID=A0ABW2FGE7_9BACL
MRNTRAKGTSGAVSVYFIVATASLFLLTSLLIDFARIAAFRKQAELAVKSGARSAMSSFDPLVYAKYGLFIRGGEAANDIFQATLEGNSPAEGGGEFAFLDTRWERAEVTESRPLAGHDLFRRQILEEMKYKAPIDLTIELAGRFKGLSGTMKEAARTVDLLERMRQAYDRREKALDEAYDSQKKHGERAGRRAETALGPAGGVVSGYSDYVAKREEDKSRRESLRRWEEERRKRLDNGEDPEEIERDKPEGPRYEAEVAAYESRAVAAARELGRASDETRAESNGFVSKAREALARARQANEEMIAIVEQSNRADGANGETSGDAMEAEHRHTMEELRKSAEDLILKPGFFSDYGAEIDRQYADGVSLAGELSSYSSLIGSAPGSTGMGAALSAGETRANGRLSEFSGSYGSGGRVVAARLKLLEDHRSHDDERKRAESEAEAEWQGAGKFLNSFSGLSGSEEDQAGFERVGELYKTNREWNRAEEEAVRGNRNGDPSQGRDEALTSVNGLLDVLEGAVEGTRDQLYFSEYTLGRMSHFAPSSVKNLLGASPGSLDVHAQETEYILYGLNHPSGNIAAAYGEIFAFRLAIRTVEGLIECRTMGHPLLVLAAALVYGITQAMSDMGALLNTGKIQLSKYLKVDTYYTDYLRLFLLLHGGGANPTARTIAVMEHASGLDFRGAYTYASGEGTASIRLWFFPGLLKVMGKVGNLGGTIKGNRYEATYIADHSYV